MTDAAQTEEKASRCGTYATFVVLMLLTVGGIKQLPWPMWPKVVLVIAADLLVGAAVYGTASKSNKPQVPPGRSGPLSVGAGVRPTSSQPEPTRPEPEPPPQPTKPPEPEPPKPEAVSEETLGTVERFGYRVGRGIAIVLLVAVVAVPAAVVWWLIARSLRAGAPGGARVSRRGHAPAHPPSAVWCGATSSYRSASTASTSTPRRYRPSTPPQQLPDKLVVRGPLSTREISAARRRTRETGLAC